MTTVSDASAHFFVSRGGGEDDVVLRLSSQSVMGDLRCTLPLDLLKVFLQRANLGDLLFPGLIVIWKDIRVVDDGKNVGVDILLEYPCLFFFISELGSGEEHL